MNDNQIVNEDVILITDDEKIAVSSIVSRIVELIKEKHL
jgi:hypothetical protein